MTTQRASQAAVSYDAVNILGFGPGSPDALPEAGPGEIVLRYGGWSLQELRAVQPDLMWDLEWHDRYRWSSERLPTGVYLLRLPIPESNCKTFDRQKRLLLPNEEPAPVVLAATALLAIQLCGGDDLLEAGWTRCKERTDDGRRVALDWYVRRLDVARTWDACRYDNVWLSAARRIA